MGFKSKEIMKKLSPSIVANHLSMDSSEVVGCLKAYAYFDHLDLDARDSLVKAAIKSS